MLAKGEVIKSLLKAHKENDNEKFNLIINNIIIEEESKNHLNFANQLKNIIQNHEKKQSQMYHHSLQFFDKLPRDSERQGFLLDVKNSQFILDDVILSEENKEIIEDVLDDNYKVHLLKTYNMKPKHKILFCGPPGCGKTLTAEAIAGEMQLPLVYTKLDAIVSSYLGDTSSNLRKVFDYIETGRSVVFFDEFDAIGKSRDDNNEHGEIKRVVNSFLQMLDTYEGNSILIAATNHQGLLDKALWRRFDEIIYFEKPNVFEIELLIKLKLRIYPNYNLNIRALSEELLGMSHNDIERICKDAIRFCVKSNIKSIDEAIFSKSINKQKRRLEIYLK